jgi:hypothetical protein
MLRHVADSVSLHKDAFLRNLRIDFILYKLIIPVKWVPCHHGMARPQVADGGEGLQIWRVAANILNK